MRVCAFWQSSDIQTAICSPKSPSQSHCNSSHLLPGKCHINNELSVQRGIVGDAEVKTGSEPLPLPTLAAGVYAQHKAGFIEMYLLLPFYPVLFILANGSLINLLWRTAWRDVMNPFSTWVSPFTTTWIDFNSLPPPHPVKYSGHFQGRIVQLHCKARLIHEWKARRWKHFFAPWMFYFQQVRFKMFLELFKNVKKNPGQKNDAIFRKTLHRAMLKLKKQ